MVFKKRKLSHSDNLWDIALRFFWLFVPLTCDVSAGRVSGASASSGELEREMKDGSSRGPAAAVPGAAWESCGMMRDRRGLREMKRLSNCDRRFFFFIGHGGCESAL